MIDFEKMKEYLDFIKNGYPFIKRGERYDLEEIQKLKELFSNYGKEIKTKVFEKGTNENRYECVLVEMACPKCGAVKLKEMTFTEFKNYLISRKENYICENCLDKILKEKQENKKRTQEDKEKQIEQSLKIFLDKFLEVGSYFNKSGPMKERVVQCKYYSDLFVKHKGQEELGRYIHDELGYEGYLDTAYWKTISAHVKYKAGYKCALCGSTENLRTHHNTNEHIGNEISHLEDLVCICEVCHEKHHFD